jgi:hypothetical protein
MHESDDNPILILTGAPGPGKTTVAQLLAAKPRRAVHLESDRFFHFIQAGYIESWKPESHEQNTTVMRIVAQAAAGYANAGYLSWLLNDHRRDRYPQMVPAAVARFVECRRPPGRLRGAAGTSRRLSRESWESCIKPALRRRCRGAPLARLRRSRSVRDPRHRQRSPSCRRHSRCACRAIAGRSAALT